MDLQKTSDDYACLGPPKPSKSLRPKTNMVLGVGEFDATTENTQRYIKHDVHVPLKPIIAGKDREFKPSNVPFEGKVERILSKNGLFINFGNLKKINLEYENICSWCIKT